MNEHLTNMIAAGEVVERPMGIVKECVENSIDAKASSIEVRIINGGLDCITIIDDGIGMDFEGNGHYRRCAWYRDDCIGSSAVAES